MNMQDLTAEQKARLASGAADDDEVLLDIDTRSPDDSPYSKEVRFPRSVAGAVSHALIGAGARVLSCCGRSWTRRCCRT